jgi:hypothetical protein
MAWHALPAWAHASVCFMALIVHWVMRQRLKSAKHEASPDRALQLLKRIQRHSIRINDGQPITGTTSITEEQASILAAMNLKKPPNDPQTTNMEWQSEGAALYESTTYGASCRTRVVKPIGRVGFALILHPLAISSTWCYHEANVAGITKTSFQVCLVFQSGSQGTHFRS